MSLRFWPAGYLNSIQTRHKYRYTFNVVSGWACIGLSAPVGTSLRLQFFIGQQQSPMTNIYFEEPGMHMSQLWEPSMKDQPNFGDDEELLVGCVIFENMSLNKRFSKHTECRMTTVGEGLLTRSLSCMSPSPWIDRKEERRSLSAYKEMALTGAGWTREKRYYPHAANILTCQSTLVARSVDSDTKTKAKSKARRAILKEVESLPWNEPDEPDSP